MAIGLQIKDGDYVIACRRVNFVQNKEKTGRDFAKMLMTDAVAQETPTKYYRYNHNYGTYLNRRQLYRGVGKNRVIDIVKSLLELSIQNYIKLQEQRTNLSASEVIENIDYLAYWDPVKKNTVSIKFYIELASGEELEPEDFELRVV